MNVMRTALNLGSLALVAMIGWLLVRTVLGLLNLQSLYEPAPIVEPSAAVVQVGASRDYDFSSNPFSLSDTTLVATELAVDAPETSLNLTLKGITTESSAILGLPTGQEKNFQIGEEIMNGVKLRAIGKDFVTLDVNGEVQRLTLERVKEGALGNQPIIRRAPTPTAMPTRAVAENLFSKVDIVPEFSREGDGLKKRGFKIKPKPGADLSAFGLQADDIVTRIGPVLLGRNRVNIAELQELIATGAAQDIEVIRNGAPVTIRIGR